MTPTGYTLLDTDVSYLWQGITAQRFHAALAGRIPVLSFATIGEVHFGAQKARWGDVKVRKMEAEIRKYLVVPWDPEIAKLWGRVKAQATASGHPLGHKEQSNDLWICATAIRHDVPLLTNNRKHFDGMAGLQLLDA